MAVRGVIFYYKEPPPRELFWLMKEYRLMVNKTIRTGLETGLTSRYSICSSVYKQYRKEHNVYSQYIPSVCEVAGGILKTYRKMLRKKERERKWKIKRKEKKKKGKGSKRAKGKSKSKGKRKGRPRTRTEKDGQKVRPPKIPFVRRLFLNCENQTYKLDRRTGRIRLPIRAGKRIEIQLEVSSYHRKYLLDEDLVLGSLTICPNKVVVTFRKDSLLIPGYEPETVIAIDTNMRSYDGVLVDDKDDPLPIRWDLSEAAIIQERHFERRRRLQKKKVYDRRTKRRLLWREGRRERNRVMDRLHDAANRLVMIASVRKSVIVLENLTGLKSKHWDRNRNRKLSSWSRRKLHQVIEYKAEWVGIPVVKVDPSYTSRTCPVCGWVRYKTRKDRRSRPKKDFKCSCGWSCDNHINASLNILKKAIASDDAVARAVQVRPDASWYDPMRSLYDLFTGARTEASRMSGVTEV